MKTNETQETGATLGVLSRLSSLADETRARILGVLEDSELTVGELCKVLQLPQSTVSRHLGILSGEGWLDVRTQGTSHHYKWSSSLPGGAEALWAPVRVELEDTGLAARDRTRVEEVLRARSDRSKSFFSSNARDWERIRRDLFGGRADLQLLPALLNGDEVVGDLGCGTGHLSELVAPFAARVHAIDRSPEMIREAKARLRHLGNVEVRPGELGRLPLPDACLDVAVLSLVLPYVEDVDAVLADVARVVRPGGRVLVLDISVGDEATVRDEMGQVRPGLAAGEIESALESSGFRDVRVVHLPADPDAAAPRLFVVRAVRT
jgi:ArsR family transcriptional regulator